MTETTLSIDLLLFLFFAASVAGFLDTLAGGGGLITLPSLILSGIPPLPALGTNKLQGSMGTLTATLVMLRTRKVKWYEVRTLMLSAFIGSLMGTVAVQFLNTELLNFVIPVVLLCIAVYFLVNPSPGRQGARARLSMSLYRRAVVPVIGWYDGMFGPGTGSFFALAGVSLRGLGLIDATAVAKTLNFSTNLASLIVFLIVGKLVWVAGLIMMLGQFFGAWLGSFYLIRIPHQYLRLIVVCMCLGMLTKYTFTMGWLG